MKNMYAITLLTASLVVLSGCWKLSISKESPSFVLVNVLEKKFYDDCHIKGSINLEFDKVLDFARNNWDKEKTEVVVYCSNYQCTASGSVAKDLVAEGFKKVYAYEGGTAEWYQKGYPTEGPCIQRYVSAESMPSEDAVHDYPVISIEDLKKKIDENTNNVG
jgi:rhodanese-related sulfurtransferase